MSEYRETLEKNIFTCIEVGKMSYADIMCMPVLRMYNYLKWKASLEEEKQKMMSEEFMR